MNYTCLPSEMTESLKYKLRSLMVYHSAMDIYTTLQDIYQEDYIFYQTIFASPSAHATPPANAPTPAPHPTQQTPLTQSDVPVEQLNGLPKIHSNTKIRIIKKVVPKEELPAQEPSQALPETLPQALPVPEVVEVTYKKADERVRKAQIKKEQTEKEAAKHADLVSKGIDPESLLTKANLKIWIVDNNLSYTQIARDYVGLPSSQIGTVAKGFGFDSPITKKRAMIISKRRIR